MSAPTDLTVSDVLAKIENPKRHNDSKVLVDLFEEVTPWPAVVWDGGFIGFGEYHYRYESGREPISHCSLRQDSQITPIF